MRGLILAIVAVGCGGGDTGGSQDMAASSGALTATFSNASGTNADTSAFTGTSTSGSFVPGLPFSMHWSEPAVSGNRIFDFFTDQNAVKPPPGTVYHLALPVKPSGGTYIEYDEAPLAGGMAPHTWFTTAGTLTLIDLSASGATISLQGANFASGSDGNTAGTGTFTVTANGICQNIQQ